MLSRRRSEREVSENGSGIPWATYSAFAVYTAGVLMGASGLGTNELRATLLLETVAEAYAVPSRLPSPLLHSIVTAFVIRMALLLHSTTVRCGGRDCGPSPALSLYFAYVLVAVVALTKVCLLDVYLPREHHQQLDDL